MTTPHDKALEAFQIEEVQMVEYVDGFKQPTDPMYRIVANGYCADFPSRAAAENFRREFSSATISAYLSSIGGVVCTREPVGAWYEDGTGCFHMSLNVELEEKKARENGHQIHYFHEPIEAGNGGDGWISVEDKLPGEQGQDGEEVLCFHPTLASPQGRRRQRQGLRLVPRPLGLLLALRT